jgi:hypothetical protein
LCVNIRAALQKQLEDLGGVIMELVDGDHQG